MGNAQKKCEVLLKDANNPLFLKNNRGLKSFVSSRPASPPLGDWIAYVDFWLGVLMTSRFPASMKTTPIKAETDQV